LNQHLDKTTKSLKKRSFIWWLPGPPAFAREASEGCRAEAHRARAGFVRELRPGKPRQTKISKTTPCTVAGGRPFELSLENILTRRANQRYYSIVARRQDNSHASFSRFATPGTASSESSTPPPARIAVVLASVPVCVIPDCKNPIDLTLRPAGLPDALVQESTPQ
jgi:hypothetical protein